MGMSNILQTLGVERKYELPWGCSTGPTTLLRWMIFGAFDVGAPHARRRWFCLGIRSDSNARMCLKRILSERGSGPALYPWRTCASPPVMTLHTCWKRRLRCAALGNAVVPDCVRYAFHLLASWPDEASTPAESDALLPNGSIDGTHPWPLCESRRPTDGVRGIGVVVVIPSRCTVCDPFCPTISELHVLSCSIRTRTRRPRNAASYELRRC